MIMILTDIMETRKQWSNIWDSLKENELSSISDENIFQG